MLETLFVVLVGLAGGIAVGIVSVIVINRQSKQMRIKRQKAKVGKK